MNFDSLVMRGISVGNIIARFRYGLFDLLFCVGLLISCCPRPSLSLGGFFTLHFKGYYREPLLLHEFVEAGL